MTHEYLGSLNEDELRKHLVQEHDLTEELANRLGLNGLRVMHVGAHESMDEEN